MKFVDTIARAMKLRLNILAERRQVGKMLPMEKWRSELHEHFLRSVDEPGGIEVPYSSHMHASLSFGANGRVITVCNQGQLRFRLTAAAARPGVYTIRWKVEDDKICFWGRKEEGPTTVPVITSQDSAP
jgi:hypothetical protein